MKNLVIVESPTKAKTISKFLGKDYVIRFSMGHIMDLPKSKMGIEMDNNFEPLYEVIDGKQSLIAELKRDAKVADTVLLATDPDREGEAIASHIQDILIASKKGTAAKLKRIVFHEITEGAIKEALEHSRNVDEHLVDAQTARRVLDRLVGYQLSPILWKKVRRGLSAGRVQSVALRLIVEREREIEKFGKEPYFTIHGMFRVIASGAKQSHSTEEIAASSRKSGPPRNDVEFTLLEVNGEKVDVSKKLNLYDGEYTFGRTIIDKQEKADAILLDAKDRDYIVGTVNTREAKRSPYPPFTTSTLQQQAASRFGLPGKRTMSLAQKLYEEGFITYHRTDSVNLSPVAIKQMREYVQHEFGAAYIPAKERLYFTKQKNAQEAHEAIRPTEVTRRSPAVKEQLGDSYAKLYELIWQRAVASQMSDARIESTTVFADSASSNKNKSLLLSGEGQDEVLMKDNIDSSRPHPSPLLRGEGNHSYRFKATGSVLLFDGFLKLTPLALDDKQLPKFTMGEPLLIRDARADEHETTPPPRYNDASLIKTLEEKSIGRPSTYASIIGTITDRGYIERLDRKFVPTSVGMAVNDFLVKNFGEIDDIPFTAQMEDDLDAIASGEKEWHAMMHAFYTPFSKKLKEVEGAERIKIPVEDTGEKCPQCHEGNLVIRTGRFGKFFSCSTFPACRFTKQFVEETNVLCPKDGGKVVVKKTKKGRKFFGCSNYPNCDFAAWKLEDIKKTTTTPKKKATKK